MAKAWIGALGLSVAAAAIFPACDRPVEGGGRVPRGEIQEAQVALMPVDGPIGGPLGGPDPAPGDCTTQGCAQPINPCTAAICNPSTGFCELVANDGAPCEDGSACT